MVFTVFLTPARGECPLAVAKTPPIA